ncbi:pyridoxal 5'-phosphate synthase glutaminase subunit PdxT [Pontibacillus litoralis]|uniref:Pyridoxal 5'-phosphate synthase subunit PdxT n=1 Tax=Pontibacillus litoralis JSM 072002 TaxID=1385512 RepID=A0A0A5FXX0_9BACI|nr:pyridoxal 5'-phosphate synthase glutaminase subunit PdxT [Pontibacillus litoralis]KGX85666.1 glutamine amidotransferase [Pontibacillus litoralis JSM 072002]
MTKIGVLGLQGAVREHIRSLEANGVEGIVIKRVEQLQDIDGLILPGGESTTMRRLIDKYEFLKPLQQYAKSGKPMYGTCAGLIMLAKHIEGSDFGHLQVMDVTVERNAFGRQVASFEAELNIKGIADKYEAVFIRAPYIVEASDAVEVLATYDGKIVAAQQGTLLASAFHPELTDDHRFTGHFVKMVEESKKTLAS